MIAISFPFHIDGFGKVATTTEMPKIWADRVRSVVSTSYGERLMRATFGSGLPSNVFSVADTMPELVDADLANAFSTWLPGITYVGTEVVSNIENASELTVNYQIPKLEKNSSDVYSISI